MVVDFQKVVKENKKLKEKSKKQGNSKLLKGLHKKVSDKKILSKSKTTVTIKKFVLAPYVSRYFKEEIDEMKRSMFFE